MADIIASIIRLSELQIGQEAECFAALVRKNQGRTKYDKPYIKCLFRDKRVTAEAPIWSDNRFFSKAADWPEGIAYRLKVRADGYFKGELQIQILDIRPAGDDDKVEGFDFYDLVESSKRPPDEWFRKILDLVDKHIDDSQVSRLVLDILSANSETFQRMPAAQNLHHSYSGGLAEHVWSVTRVAVHLANHYGKYYENELNPPLNKSVIVAAAILHDIGKLRELDYHPVETRYTKQGTLIGHILMGRDLVRETARQIPDFPEETLLLLEHAILAHHGKPEFGAPKAPATLEAMIVHYVDELDAKINAVVCEYERSNPDEAFTDKIYAVENRRFYKGIPVEERDEDENDLA